LYDSKSTFHDNDNIKTSKALQSNKTEFVKENNKPMKTTVKMQKARTK